MQKVPSTHRFHVAKVEFEEQKLNNGSSVKPDADDVVPNGTGASESKLEREVSVDSPSATVTFFPGGGDTVGDTYGHGQNTYQYNTNYGTHLKTFGKNTTEAIPHVDHYRNLLSATSALKSRPTLAELHEEKVRSPKF